MAAQVGGGGSHEGGDGFGEHGCGRSEGVRRREQRWCGSNRCRARGGWCRVGRCGQTRNQLAALPLGRMQGLRRRCLSALVAPRGMAAGRARSGERPTCARQRAANASCMNERRCDEQKSGGRVRSVSSYVCVVWGQGVCQCIPLTPLYTYYSGGFVWFCHLEVTVTGPISGARAGDWSLLSGAQLR